MTESSFKRSEDFIRSAVANDLSTGDIKQVQTRFPPEPNGYLHIGHAMAINLNFNIAEEYGGKCNLRFDDTNPIKEDQEYIESIKEDIKWLGFRWDKDPRFASDYFEILYSYAINLIKSGNAYVDSLSQEDIQIFRGTLQEPGKDSPYRERSVNENLDLFESMKNGEFSEGSHVLRAKIDMSAANMNLRDPVMYRILSIKHHRTGSNWSVYPTYDFAHGQSDSIEGISHSICTLEFEDHKPLYDWFQEKLAINKSKQMEFAGMKLSHTVLSKRKLNLLVQNGSVSGWDDPRMPTLAGLRRLGVPPEAILNFCDRIGITKKDSVNEIEMLEHSIRQNLNLNAPRFMAVLNPLKVVITNYPDQESEHIEAVNNPEDQSMGSRKIPFSKTIFIEREDFMEDPPRKFFRLAPGREVRLRYAYFIRCVDVIKDSNGEIIELHCTYDPETLGGSAPDGRKVRATLHWVSEIDAFKAEVRLYDRLFAVTNPGIGNTFEELKMDLNQYSLQVRPEALLESSLMSARSGTNFQFERQGYFCVDSKDSNSEKLVFNRTCTLRDSWGKINK